MLFSIGIVMIYRLDEGLAFKQIIWFAAGIVVFFIAYFGMKLIKSWEKWIYLYAAASLVLFVVTLIFGSNIKGATNWIIIGNFSFQPAELIKILFVFFIASYYVNKDKLKNDYIFLAIVYCNLGFLFLQKDLGTALIFFMVFMTIYYVYEEKRKLILYNIIAFTLIGIVSYFIFNHVQIRFETWINPWRYIDNRGYQITQSLFAIASGGFFGTGIGLGYPGYIPEVHNDFIFSAICEEMGIFTGIAIVMLFLIFVYRGFKISLNQNSKFFRIVSLGITATLGFQAFIILGGVIKMIPLTGVTLPFVSYGGSSLVSSFALLGILQMTSEDIDIEGDKDYEYRTEKDN